MREREEGGGDSGLEARRDCHQNKREEEQNSSTLCAGHVLATGLSLPDATCCHPKTQREVPRLRMSNLQMRNRSWEKAELQSKPLAWNSLAVQWLGLCILTAVSWVQSLVGELRSHKPCGAAQNKKGSLVPRPLLCCVRGWGEGARGQVDGFNQVKVNQKLMSNEIGRAHV